MGIHGNNGRACKPMPNERILSKDVRCTLRDILLPCDLEIFLHKSPPTVEGYDPFETCRRVSGKDFKNIKKLCAHQLTLPCKFLKNIIAHVIFSLKGHLDKVNRFNLFIMDHF